MQSVHIRKVVAGLLIAVLASLTLFTAPVVAGGQTAHNARISAARTNAVHTIVPKPKAVAYVNYDDSGFTGGYASGNIFGSAILGGPAATGSASDPVSYDGFTFYPIVRSALSASVLTHYGTLLLYEECDIATSMTATQHTAINNYLAAGNKILIFDSDRCYSSDSADYSWFTFPFATSNPGPAGANGVDTVVENSTLTRGTPNGSRILANDPFNSDEMGDANTAIVAHPTWCAAAQTTNTLGNNGFWLAYARHKGLVIFNGADNWATYGGTQSLTDTFLNMLNQKWNSDGLPCKQLAEGTLWQLSPENFANAASGSPSNPYKDSYGHGDVWAMMEELGRKHDSTLYTNVPNGFNNATCGVGGFDSWNTTNGPPAGQFYMNTTAANINGPQGACLDAHTVIAKHKAEVGYDVGGGAARPAVSTAPGLLIYAWHSPISGKVSVNLAFKMRDCGGGGEGVKWSLDKATDGAHGSKILAKGSLTNCGHAKKRLVTSIKSTQSLYVIVDYNKSVKGDVTQVDETIKLKR